MPANAPLSVPTQGPSAFCILNSPAVPPPPSSFILPPSSRDLEIHRQNAVELLSTRNIAERFALSQTRVRQIVARVSDWLTEMLPLRTDADLERQKRYSLHLAAAQLQHQIEKLNIIWDATTDPKFLRQQTRAIVALARLGASPTALDGITAQIEEEAEPAPPNLVTRVPPDLVTRVHPNLVTRVPPGNAPTQSSPLGTPAPSQSAIPNPHSEFCILNSEIPSPPPPRACSPATTTAAEATAPQTTPSSPIPNCDLNLQDFLATDPEHLAGLEIMEKRLLTLLADTLPSDAKRRQGLSETLSRVRREQATVVLKLNPQTAGVTTMPPTSESGLGTLPSGLSNRPLTPAG